MRKVKNPETINATLSILQHNKGRQYSSATLALRLSISIESMRAILKDLKDQELISSTSEGLRKLFYIQGDPVPTEVNLAPYVPPFKPMIGYAEMMRGIASRAEAGR